jgi:hypothetical protein
VSRLLSAAARLAVALLLRLGVALRPLADTGPATPAAVPLVAMASPWYPSAALGLPGDWPPIERGAP